MEEYTSNKESRTLIWLLPSLSFVPIEDVESLFDLVAQNYPEDERFVELLSYFYSNYIMGPAKRKPQFPEFVEPHGISPSKGTQNNKLL